jgi:tRNA(Arg) A34 adenosine deaminase TadA
MSLSSDDERFLRQSFGIAAQARAAGNHPFGALLVDARGQLVEVAQNTVVTGHDPTGHAETNLVRLAGAAQAERGVDLAGCTLYTSTEPCAMCAGAIHWAGIGRMVYGLSEKGLLEIVGPANDQIPTLDLPSRQVLAAGSRSIVVDGPFLEDEARVVHDGFWT